MSLFNKFKNSVLGFVNDDFLNAITAACALVAYADGDASEDEKKKMMKYMKINDDLRHFSMTKVEDRYQKYIESIDFDINLGRIECYKAIEEIRENRENCNKLVSVCIAIGKSDGKIDADEQNQIIEIARRLGLNINNFTM